jgi:hypothetical protein
MGRAICTNVGVFHDQGESGKCKYVPKVTSEQMIEPSCHGSKRRTSKHSTSVTAHIVATEIHCRSNRAKSRAVSHVSAFQVHMSKHRGGFSFN